MSVPLRLFIADLRPVLAPVHVGVKLISVTCQTVHLAGVPPPVFALMDGLC